MSVRIHPDDLHNLPGLTPKHDETFMQYLEAALNGSRPIYFAAVPLACFIPFDQDYRPDLHPVGAAAIADTFKKAQAGQHRKLITYKRGYWFIVSDDYIPYFAAMRGLPDYVPCFIIGEPDQPLVRDIQGPIDPISFKKAIGLG